MTFVCSSGLWRGAAAVMACCAPLFAHGAEMQVAGAQALRESNRAPRGQQKAAHRGEQPAGKASTPANKSQTDETASREEQFRHLLTGATLSGTWQMTTFEDPEHPAQLSKPQPETYTISEVSKAGGDHWLITARIQYADKDVLVPVMVRVVWSGDTPVITVDNFSVPLIGLYSARVMVYRGLYAGTWFGKGYGGVLSGRITKTQDKNVLENKKGPDEEMNPQAGESKPPNDRTGGG